MTCLACSDELAAPKENKNFCFFSSSSSSPCSSSCCFSALQCVFIILKPHLLFQPPKLVAMFCVQCYCYMHPLTFHVCVCVCVSVCLQQGQSVQIPSNPKKCKCTQKCSWAYHISFCTSFGIFYSRWWCMLSFLEDLCDMGEIFLEKQQDRAA